jgi:hypothetical protein
MLRRARIARPIHYPQQGDQVMPGTLQEFVAQALEKLASEVEAALLRLPEEKRSWSPMGQARTALDQVAECAIVNGSTARLMSVRTWPVDFDMAQFQRSKADLAADWGALKDLFQQNTATLAAAIRALPDEDLSVEVETPFRKMTLSGIIGYAYWNMSYHEGQINYIASMLGCLG